MKKNNEKLQEYAGQFCRNISEEKQTKKDMYGSNTKLILKNRKGKLKQTLL